MSGHVSKRPVIAAGKMIPLKKVFEPGIKTIAALLVFAALAFLPACQGVSTGGSSQQQMGNLVLSSTSLSFGSVSAGSSKTLTVTAGNSGSKSVTLSSAAISTKYFSLMAPSLPAVISPGQNLTLTLQFSPNASGTFNATIAFTSDAADAVANLSVQGTGVADGDLVSNPASEDFGNVTVGSAQAQAVTLTNSGGTSVTVSQASISGTGFSLSGIATPLTLAAGQSASFNVSFAPQSAGAVTGTVTITSTASNSSLSIGLSGTGTTSAGQLTVTPTTLPLGSVVVGTSGTASGSLSVSGANVTVTAASTNNSVFSVGGLSLPVTISPGQSIPYTVTFSPKTTGAVSASLTFTSNAQPSTTIETLTGTGTPVPVHSVNLSWNASTSSGISGYNVYRAIYVSSCGSYSKINSVLNTSTLFTDSAVVDGTSYCYATTAVNSSNVESGYSNIVANIQIPPP
jgi:Abnormal spindle-like microcephaly-assoc'd, ASPM-SPD-2-Hydin